MPSRYTVIIKHVNKYRAVIILRHEFIYHKTEQLKLKNTVGTRVLSHLTWIARGDGMFFILCPYPHHLTAIHFI